MLRATEPPSFARCVLYLSLLSLGGALQEGHAHPQREANLTLSQQCETSDSFLSIGESKRVGKCSEKKCVWYNESPVLIITSCNIPDDNLPDGCYVKPETELDFPECCKVVIVCERFVPVVVPVVYTPANISLLERNNSENSINDHMKWNGKEFPSSNNKEIKDRERRAAPSTTTDSTPEFEVGCKTDEDEIVPLGESVQVIGKCEHLSCTSINGTIVLISKECNLPLYEIPANCRILPEPEIQFPTCCNRTMVCEEVIVTVYPVVNTSPNINELQKHDNNMKEELKGSNYYFNKDDSIKYKV